MKTKELKEKYELAALKESAKEINDVCKFEDFPPLGNKDWDGMVKVLEEAGAEIVTQKMDSKNYDVISEETETLLRDFGFWPEEEEEPEEKPEEVETAQESEQVEAAEDANVMDVREEVEDAEKLKDLKDIAKAYDEFKEIRGKLSSYKDAKSLKGDMLGIISEAPNETQPESDSTPEKKKEDKKQTLSKEKTEFGHLVSSQAGQIDLALINDGELCVADFTQKTGITKGRIKSHIKHLGEKKVKIEDFEKEGKQYYKLQ